MKMLVLCDIITSDYDPVGFREWLFTHVSQLDIVLMLGSVRDEFYQVVNEALSHNPKLLRVGLHCSPHPDDQLSRHGFWDLHLRPFFTGSHTLIGFSGVHARPYEAHFAYEESHVSDVCRHLEGADVIVSYTGPASCDARGFQAYDELLMRMKPKAHVFASAPLHQYRHLSAPCFSQGIKLFTLA